MPGAGHSQAGPLGATDPGLDGLPLSDGFLVQLPAWGVIETQSLRLVSGCIRQRHPACCAVASA